jgi:hypothetical protein
MPSHQGWVQTLEPIPVADQTTIAVRDEGALFADQFCIVPPQYLIPGSRFHIFAQGKITTPSSNNGPLVVRLRWSTAGSATGGVSVAARSYVPSLANSVTNGVWHAEFFGVCQSVGTSGTFLATGEFRSESAFANFASYQTSIMIPATSPTTATVDTTLQKMFSLTASGSSSSCSMTGSQLQISFWS